MLAVTNLGQWYKYAAVATAAGAISAGIVAWSAPASAQGSRSSLEARMRIIEDKEQIHDLLIEYGHDLDTHDLVGYSNLFARDGEWSGSLGHPKGPAAVLAMLQHSVGKTPFDPRNVKSFHMMTNIVIQVDGDRATAQSKWTFFTRGQDDKPIPTLSGHYQDSLIREDGRWKFLSRVALHDIPS
jgi:hypothetical protein